MKHLAIGIVLVALVGCGGGGAALVDAALTVASTALTWEEALDRWGSSPQREVQHTRQDGIVQEAADGSLGFTGEPYALVDLVQGDAVGEPAVQSIGSNAAIIHAEVVSHVSRSELLRYLRADADDRGGVRRWGDTPPTVRVAAGASQETIRQTRTIVAVLNASLPTDWQMRFDPRPAPAAGDYVTGEILVTFAEKADWPYERGPRVSGVSFNRAINHVIDASQIWIDHTRVSGQQRLEYIAHELLHSLGRDHVDAALFPDTIMDTTLSAPHFDAVIRPLDDQALHAVYSRLNAGTSPDLIASDLGPWEDTSFHGLGALVDPGERALVVFGASVRNGRAGSWAIGGPVPSQPLRGSATWSGRLVGMTPDARAVAGAADMAVALGSISGTLAFTELEAWGSRQMPGQIGTGSQWLDGDLHYSIAVQGSRFVRTGGDAGRLEGTFFGPSHEIAGGTLDRADLAAAFGAARNGP